MNGYLQQMIVTVQGDFAQRERLWAVTVMSAHPPVLELSGHWGDLHTRESI
ncbi:MAG: hypothetical protein R2867_36570 [Caldilineaceae bacterium]